MDVFLLSRNWFDFCFENPEKVNPSHTALYFFCIEQCNRLGWKEKFGLPLQMSMDAIGVRNYKTFSRAFNDLIEWGFLKLIQKSRNQYSANIIALVENTKASTKALSKAMLKHSQKQVRGTVGIDIPIYQLPNTILSQVSPDDLPDENSKLYFTIAKGFYDQIEKNLTELKVNSNHLKKAKYLTWTEPIRLLVTRDEYKIEEIRDVLRFLKDEPFNEKFMWKTEIRSTSKLREKFETLLLKARTNEKIKIDNTQSKKGNGQQFTVKKVTVD